MSEPPVPDAPHRSIGLRLSITAALVVGLGLFVVLVGITAEGFTRRAIVRERTQTAAAAAAAVAAIVERSDAPLVRLDEAEDLVVGRYGVTGFRVGERERGVVAEGVSADQRLPDGGVVRVFVRSDEGAGALLVRLLILYAALSALAILLLTYALLGRLIVTPIAELTRAADRLARGVEGARAEPAGAAEIGNLATTFNRMARDLSAERAALRGRLTELERAHQELERKDASLVRSEKLASVGRLAAGVAHEIGNPLTSILGLVDLLEQGGLDEATQREFLRRIHAETDRIHRTIRGLLDFSRQGPAEAAEGADVAAAVERAVSLAGPQKDMRRVTLERRLPDAPVRVKLTEEHLVQVLLNLLMNAADAIAGEGSISIEVEGGDVVRIRVSDTGPGIAPEVEATLFEPFVTTKPAGKGTGLGLAVVHSIVERAGGSIAVERPEGGGARFVVSVPAA